MNADEIIAPTKCWIKSVVVACNFCPFAKRELERETIRFAVCGKTDVESCLIATFDEFIYLDKHKEIETTLIIFPKAFGVFDDFLNAIDLAEQLLNQQGYEGVYQLASFHPDYCFSETDENDAANYTNRSPFPMLHLLRESSLEKALSSYKNAEDIPQKNVEHAREIGVAEMKKKLERCCHE